MHTDAYLEVSQTFKIELFARIVNGQKTVAACFFVSSGVWLSFEYAFDTGGWI